MRLLLCLLFTLCAISCSSVEKKTATRAEHDELSVSAIDDMIISLKKEYIERCYTPVLKREILNSPRPCQTALSQLLERRYYANFTQDHLDMAADELFFADVRKRLTERVKKEKSLKQAVGKRFSSMDELMNYYKPRYSFQDN